MNRGDRREANSAAAPARWRFLETVERRRKGDPSKVPLAAAVRAGTTVPLAWLRSDWPGQPRLSDPASVSPGPETLEYDNTTN